VIYLAKTVDLPEILFKKLYSIAVSYGSHLLPYFGYLLHFTEEGLKARVKGIFQAQLILKVQH